MKDVDKDECDGNSFVVLGFGFYNVFVLVFIFLVMMILEFFNG